MPAELYALAGPTKLDRFPVDSRVTMMVSGPQGPTRLKRNGEPPRLRSTRASNPEATTAEEAIIKKMDLDSSECSVPKRDRLHPDRQKMFTPGRLANVSRRTRGSCRDLGRTTRGRRDGGGFGNVGSCDDGGGFGEGGGFVDGGSFGTVASVAVA
ncbi:unnamed protein product [Toxocara canis]|uniref:Uncharacterized protein n=1 Tax=Toxocara canis TaxID=6265 RepID=A0A183VG88_TOXCA|nr:unnamed protein product [Toxocara canis]